MKKIFATSVVSLLGLACLAYAEAPKKAETKSELRPTQKIMRAREIGRASCRERV